MSIQSDELIRIARLNMHRAPKEVREGFEAMSVQHAEARGQTLLLRSAVEALDGVEKRVRDALRTRNIDLLGNSNTEMAVRRAMQEILTLQHRLEQVGKQLAVIEQDALPPPVTPTQLEELTRRLDCLTERVYAIEDGEPPSARPAR